MSVTSASAIPPAYCDRCYRVVRLYVHVRLSSVTAKAVRRNEMPFGRDTYVVPGNIELDREHGPPREGEILGAGTASLQRYRLMPNYFGPCYCCCCCCCSCCCCCCCCCCWWWWWGGRRRRRNDDNNVPLTSYTSNRRSREWTAVWMSRLKKQWCELKYK